MIAALHSKRLSLTEREARGTHTAFCLPEHTKHAREVMGPDAWVCPSVMAILERDATKARARARQHLSFYANQENYQRIFLAQGFTRADFDNGCSDHLVDTVIAWGSEEHIRDRIDAHLAAGANHICLMPLRCDEPNLPDERAFEAFAP